MFFTPRYIKEGRELLDAVRKGIAYRRDLIREADLLQADELQAELREALRQRDAGRVAAASDALKHFCAARFPAVKHPMLSENTEVFLVAIVIAMAIRTFFLQPFTIPTGSMQPTLNGIRVVKTEAPAPNILQRVAEYAVLGRSYFEITPEVDDRVVRYWEVTKFFFFRSTVIQGERQQFEISAPASGLIEAFGLPFQKDDPHIKTLVGLPLRKGVTLSGYADTGDHVFVNKMAYHFRKPTRGEVFVFHTQGIMTDENRANPNAPSQYYIKRLAGLPGDELRIAPPLLFVNGQEAQEPGFQRVMSAVDGYRGYGNGPAYLTAPDAVYHLPEKRFFALGDNSYNSGDSRYWGTVPEDNLVGVAFIVYWPFTRHWGLIR